MTRKVLLISFLLSALILLSLGVVMLTSTSIWVEKDLNYSHLKKHLIWFFLGSFSILLVYFCDYRYLKIPLFGVLLFLFGAFLLSLCYTPLGIERNGETRWLPFPVIGQFQPSEIAKITTIIVLSSYFFYFREGLSKFSKGLIFPLLLLGIPCSLILFEKDIGTSLTLGVSGILVFISAGVRLSFLFPMICLGAIPLGLIARLSPNRWNRIIAFTNLEENRFESGHQQWRALLAFQNGKFSGAGLGASVEKHGYLPFAHTDFIYPILAEELGLFFSLITIFSFAALAISSMFLAFSLKDYFAKILVVGLSSLIFVPALINMAVSTALIPNTGLPLPFISYGGSNLIFTLISLGILLSITRTLPREKSFLGKLEMDI